MNSSDDQLIAAYRQTGDARALDELVRRHIPGVRAVIYAMVLNDAIADDLTQDVFVRALRGLSQFDGRAQFSTWLHQIAVNRTRSHFTKAARTAGNSRKGESLTTAVSRDLQPDRILCMTETSNAISDALDKLPLKLRTAIALISLNGMSAAEAARIEGCTSATMHWRVYEARRRLKTALRGHLQ